MNGFRLRRPQALSHFPLRLFPIGQRPLHEFPTPGGQAEELGAAVIGTLRLDPALGPHPLDVAAHRGFLDAEDPADLALRGQLVGPEDDQDAELADSQVQRPKGGLVDVGDLPADEPGSARVAAARDPRRRILLGFAWLHGLAPY